MCMTTLISKTTLHFCHEWQRVRVSSRHFSSTRRASISIHIIIIVVVVISILECLVILDASGGGEGDSTKPLRWACHLAMRPTRVFTWYISIVSVSRQASMRWSYATITSRVIPLAEEKGTEVDRAEGVEGAADPDHLERSYASLCLMVTASMAHITWKWSDTGKGTEKWCRILVIAEGKMSLSQVAVSLCTSMIERMKWEGKYIVRWSNRESKNRGRDSVIELDWERGCKTKVMTMLRNLGPLVKAVQELNWRSPQSDGCSQKEEMRSSLDTVLRRSQSG